jgi:biotin operon repressor
MNKTWTDTERQYLKRHYNVKSTEDIAVALDRSPSQIASQVYYLRRRGWTFNRRGDAKY